LPGRARAVGGRLKQMGGPFVPAAVNALFKAICGPVMRAPSMRSMTSGKPPSSVTQTVSGTPMFLRLGDGGGRPSGGLRLFPSFRAFSMWVLPRKMLTVAVDEGLARHAVATWRNSASDKCLRSWAWIGGRPCAIPPTSNRHLQVAAKSGAAT